MSIKNKHFLLGIVPNAGQQPVAEKDIDTFLVTGPMSRYCTDLMTMYRVLAAPNIHKLKLDTKARSLICWKIEAPTFERDFCRSKFLSYGFST